MGSLALNARNDDEAEAETIKGKALITSSIAIVEHAQLSAIEDHIKESMRL